MYYQIREVPTFTYVHLVRPLFRAKTTCSKEKIRDPFLVAVTGQEAPKKTILSQRLGIFHQELLSTFPGYMKINGLDIMSIDGKEVFEVKNRTNTLNKNSSIGLQSKFDSYTCKKYLIQINGEERVRHGLSNDIILLNGREAYEKISKSSTFYDRLLLTMSWTFRFNTFEEFVQALYQHGMLTRRELRCLFDDTVV